MKRTSTISLFFLVFTFFISLIRAGVPSEESNMKTILEKQNSFSFKFCSEITHEELKADLAKNIFVSPFSLNMALNLVLNAVDGETKNELSKVMNLSSASLEKINSANKWLLENLTTKPPIGAVVTKGVFTLEIANGIWLDNLFTVHPEYKNLVEKYYQTQFSTLDFSDYQSATRINDWVSLKTHGKIPEIITADQLQNLVMLIANATYFKGQWESPFPIESTKNDQHFNSWLDNPGSESISMMEQVSYLSYFEDKYTKIVEMPYVDSKVSAYIMLPNKKGYDSYMEVGDRIWTSTFWQQLDKNLKRKQGVLSMPIFQIEYKKILNDDLRKLGINSIFNNDANFSKLTPTEVAVSIVLQKTFVKVNEFGTEAAAVTGIGVRETCEPDEPSFKMLVNRPFYFVIREKNSGSFLFVGAITKL
ncbi:MAG: serpin family protein [Oligoflexia bacterium]|nr:serpin family protein [Oligoflexia bacterium]